MLEQTDERDSFWFITLFRKVKWHKDLNKTYKPLLQQTMDFRVP